MKQKAIIFYVSEDMHKEIRIRASLRGMTIKAYALLGLEVVLAQDKRYMVVDQEDGNKKTEDNSVRTKIS